MAAYKALYRTQRWRRLARMIVIRDLGICQVTAGCPRPASCADHIVPAFELWTSGRLHLFFDPENLRASCRSCNASSGASFGNSIRRHRRRMSAEDVAVEWSRQYELDAERLEVERLAAVRRPPMPRIFY